jgi:hypothetical protein
MCAQDSEEEEDDENKKAKALSISSTSRIQTEFGRRTKKVDSVGH